MDPSLRVLVPLIRAAVDADAVLPPPVLSTAAPKTVSLEALLTEIRSALDQDERLFANEDATLAKEVEQAIPRLIERVTASYAAARSRLEKEAPWALVPLESDLDLLSPLKKGRQETAHTLYLAYLLDWRQPHGLGTRVLRELFQLLGRAIPGEDTFELISKVSDDNERRLRAIRVSAEEVVPSGHDANDTLESRRCDVWMELVEENRSLIVVIENKVDASEHSHQLSAYEGAVWQRARARRVLNFEARLVFLTPDGRPPGDEADKKLWTPIGYRQLAAALTRATRDAPEPGRSMLVLYIASILRHVLKIPSRAEGIERVRQLPFMNEVLTSLDGAT